MLIFISYSRSDNEIVEALAQSLKHERHQVFYDVSILGGENWWDVILDEIFRSDVFIFVMSNNSRYSPACLAELEWAKSVKQYILPVVIDDVDIHLFPQHISAVNVIRYSKENQDNISKIIDSVKRAPRRNLSFKRPKNPPMPLNRLDGIMHHIKSKEISLQQQRQIVQELRESLKDQNSRSRAVKALNELAKHPDVRQSVAQEINDILVKYPSDTSDATQLVSRRGFMPIRYSRKSLHSSKYGESVNSTDIANISKKVNKILDHLHEHRMAKYHLSPSEKILEDTKSRQRVRSYVECLNLLSVDEFKQLVENVLPSENSTILTRLRLALMFDADPLLVRQTISFSEISLPKFAQGLQSKILDMAEPLYSEPA